MGADLFEKLQARGDGILAIPEQTRRDLTAVWKEEVLEDLVQALEGIRSRKLHAFCMDKLGSGGISFKYDGRSR